MNNFNKQKLETEETKDNPVVSEQAQKVRYTEMKWFFKHWRLVMVGIKEVAILK